MNILTTCGTCGKSFPTTKSRLADGKGKYCSRQCSQFRSKESEAARFWSKVAIVNDDNSCWMWLGFLDRDGYGAFRPYHQPRIRAHRYAFRISNPPVPDSLFICHKCDNPTCVRPEHLFAATAKANTQDALSKNRLSRGHSHMKPHQVLRGESHPRSKFTERDVIHIRTAVEDGTASVTSLAAHFGVTRQAISAILNGKLWRHLLPAADTPTQT